MNVRRLSKYPFSSSDSLFFDTNVWLHLYGPQSFSLDHRAKVYSAAFKVVLQQKCKIFLDVLVLSEFINVIARYRYNAAFSSSSRSRPTFKAYRNSAAFNAVAKEITQACRRMSSESQYIDTDLSSFDVEDLYRQFEGGHEDFNDLALSELCRRQRLKLVTDDGDFKGHGLTILTENPKLLP
ncbi:MAG: PIN domain-containing protein [Nitrospira sp.]